MTTKKPQTTDPKDELLQEEEEIDNAEELGEIDAKTDEKGNGSEKYFKSIGRRKESTAIVRLYTRKSTDPAYDDKALVTVNNKDYTDYFSNNNLHAIVESPLKKLKSMNRFKATIKVSGGGITSQAGAIRHGLARSLVLFDGNFRKKLKKAGFLTRDPRAKERRKPGLKKARKSPRWSKR